ncbi:TIGR01777 family oxidoreductase [soil metagenome]
MPVFSRRTLIQASPDDLFRWHARPGAFERLAPPWQEIALLRHDGIKDGDFAVLKMRIGPASVTWEMVHEGYSEGRQFCDRQISGPFASWYHTHEIIPAGKHQALLDDEIKYELPLRAVSKHMAGWYADRELERVFRYRHRVTRNDVERHRLANVEPMTIAVTGSTGLIGSALVSFLKTGGHRVLRLVRSRSAVLDYSPDGSDRAAFWDPETGEIDVGALANVDAVIHLAGEPLDSLRWTSEKRRRIWESRTKGTYLLASALAGLRRKPGSFISASGSGYYGGRGSSELTEEEPPGLGFLAELCRTWEEATAPAADAGIPTTTLRLGAVLSPRGGALNLMMPAFKSGLGGHVGDGSSYVPWVSIDDVLYAILHVLASQHLEGPVNVSTPQPVPQREFGKTLAGVLGRPALLHAPRGLVSLLGEQARSTALTSTRMVPHRLAQDGFQFAYSDLESALRHLLGKDKEPSSVVGDAESESLEAEQRSETATSNESISTNVESQTS